jgi:hypothetical protein
MPTPRILAFAGSTRKESCNKHLSRSGAQVDPLVQGQTVKALRRCG